MRADSAEAFAALEAAQAPIDLGNVDFALLAEAIFHETNIRRLGEGRQALQHLTELDQAACVHAEAMVREGFFAHRNPNNPELATPLERVENQGLRVGFVAENLGQAFALQYVPGTPVYTRQEGGQRVFSREPGGQPLQRRSYLEVAEALLDGLMNSPPHRENILAETPSSFGAGCHPNRDNELGMVVFWCVQLFFDPLATR